jgi:hypothetical protein
MDTLLLIAGIVLFVAWIGGLLISVPTMWRKLIGNTDVKHRIKRSLPIKRRSKAY